MTGIILTGAAGSGKDTAADAIEDTFDNVWRASFASPLKEMACNVFWWDEMLLNELEYKQEVALWPDGSPQSVDPVTGRARTRREILQLLGTDVFRNMVDKEFWVNQLIQGIKADNEPNDVWVVTDCRFQNEFDALSEAFTHLLVIRLVRTDHEIPTSGHASEVDWRSIPADVVIEAKTGELDVLREATIAAANDFLCGGV
jgi:hypothetical protein